LDDILVSDQDPDAPKPKNNLYRRALFFRRHKLNILDNIPSKFGFKRQVLKYHLPRIDWYYKRKILNSRINFISPISPKTVTVSFDKPSPPVAILDKYKAFKIYDML
jgi:hypothetical protein